MNVSGNRATFHIQVEDLGARALVTINHAIVEAGYRVV